jgi:Family of unknown function (DUF6311)
VVWDAPVAALTWIRPLAPPVLAGAVGLAAFLVQFGPAALDPTNLHWLMSGDWGVHLLGWLMFRHAEWGWPLTSIPALAWPVDVTLAYTDSLPLLALPMKLLSPVLPDPLQYIGPWLAACFVLQGVFGALLTSAFSPKPLHATLGGALFALSPVLMTRVGHDSLCAHWLLLALLWLNLREQATARRSVIAAVALVMVAAAVHPVLWAMTATLAFALVARFRVEKQLGWGGVVASLAATVAVTALVFFAFGYLGGGTTHGGGGFGVYSADLLTLVNPMGISRVLPDLPVRPGQYEGLGYLGLGTLLLVGFAGFLLIRGRRELSVDERKRWIPVLVAVIAMALFSASNVVTLAGHQVVGLRSLYRPFLSLVEPFRSSGRFIWPLHYLLIAFALAVVLKLWGARSLWKGALLGTVLLVQAVDVRRGGVGIEADDSWFKLRAERWDGLARNRRRLVLYPPQLRDGGGRSCEGHDLWPSEFHLSAGWLALRHGMAVNSAYVARLNAARTNAYCASLERDVKRGRLDPASLYVVAPEKLGDFQGIEGVRCESLDGVHACLLAVAPGPSTSAATPE